MTDQTTEGSKQAASGNGAGSNGKKGFLGLDPAAIKEKATEDLEALKKPTKTELYKSVFRVKHDETPPMPQV